MMRKFPQKFEELQQRLVKKNIPAKLIFIGLGILSTVWFLIRVIPKPQRATYPCMRAAAPIMSSFIIWLLGVTGAFIAFRKSKELFNKAKYVLAFSALFAGIVIAAVVSVNNNKPSFAIAPDVNPVHPANTPFGVGEGIFPGRVVWAHDKDATNEDCTNSYNVIGDRTDDDGYFLPKNNNQTVQDTMFAQSIRALTGQSTNFDAMDALFHYFNNKKGRGDVGYQTDEVVFVKVNQGTTWNSVYANREVKETGSYGIAESAPTLVLSVLKQLIDVYNIPQEKIWVADPKSDLFKHMYDYLHATYPNVKYGSKDGREEIGRTALTADDSQYPMHFSDNGVEMSTAVTDYYYMEMMEADYLINMGALKAHARAGVTLTAKNHFGSHTRNSAAHMHPGLIAPENDIVERSNYVMYRVLVDIMGHEKLGGNTLLFLVDGLWGGVEATDKPVKWVMPPFNNDWPNSIFISQDQVALESVCFDFLRSETQYPGSSSNWANRPVFAQGVDDHLHQAADPNQWPDKLSDNSDFAGYDPEGDGSYLGSLGTHEHWNDVNKKQYARNFGQDLGLYKSEEWGVDLVAIPSTLVENDVVEAYECALEPSFDGVGDDECWSTAKWYGIDQIWMPWKGTIGAADFTGRFKVSWNEAQNKLYFLVETTDDFFRDGYVAPDGGYPNFDIVEIFLDENRSGDGHVFDATNKNGPNAENAFSYHIAIDQPADGATQSNFVAMDIAGTSWAVNTKKDYADHFPEFIVKRTGNTMMYEFSLNVYNDTYDPAVSAANNSAALVSLTGGKELGFAMAYCDNDADDGSRDHFIGSVPGREGVNADGDNRIGSEGGQQIYNEFWKMADEYGKMVLIKTQGEVINQAPEIIGSVSNMSIPLVNNNYEAVADVSTLFEDPESDEMLFTATTSNSKLNATIASGKLTINAADDIPTGTYTVTISANDNHGNITQLAFTATHTNVAPAKTGTMADALIEARDSYIEIVSNLPSYFTDANNNTLTIKAQSNNADLLTSILSNNLRVKAKTALPEGDYTVTVTAEDSKGAKATYTITVTLDIPVGISKLFSDQDIYVFPNPVVNNVLKLRINDIQDQNAELTIFDLSGKIVYRESLNILSNSVQTVSISELPAGHYNLLIQGADKQYVQSIIKK